MQESYCHGLTARAAYVPVRRNYVGTGPTVYQALLTGRPSARAVTFVKIRQRVTTSQYRSAHRHEEKMSNRFHIHTSCGMI